jgi:hypothetical protein
MAEEVEALTDVDHQPHTVAERLSTRSGAADGRWEGHPGGYPSRPTCSAYHAIPDTWTAISRRVQLGEREVSHSAGQAA